MAASAPANRNAQGRTGINVRIRLDAVLGAGLVAASGIILAAYEIVHRYGYSYPSPAPGNGSSIYAISPFDEGVYTETGALMAHGYQLYSQIYSAQPPFLPLVLSAVDRVAAAGLVEARWTVLVFGLIAVSALAAVAGLLRGWMAGGFAALLLVLAPEFLVYAHAVEEEIPMLALCLVSLAVAVGWWRKREFELAAAAGFFFGLAMLTKFLAVSLLAPLAVMFALTLWDRRDRWLPVARDALLFIAGAALPFLLSLFVWGQAEWRQMVNDRLGATADQASFQQGSSLHILRIFLETDPGLALLALLGGIALLVWNPKTGLVVDSWLAATLIVLLRYHPLFAHHVAVLLAPMALVGGVALAGIIRLPQPYRERAMWVGPQSAGSGLPKTLGTYGALDTGDGEDPHVPMAGRAGSLETSTQHRARPRRDRAGGVTGIPAGRSRANLAALLATAGLFAYLVLLPIQGSSYSQLLVPTTASDRQLQVAARTIDQNVPLGGFVAASDPVLCVLANRPCVPQMVDTSYVRVQTGKLAGAIRYVRRANATVVVLSRGLCLAPYMSGFVRWVRARYRLVDPMGIDSSPDCPFVDTPTGPMAAKPSWPAGIYVLAGRGFIR